MRWATVRNAVRLAALLGAAGSLIPSQSHAGVGVQDGAGSNTGPYVAISGRIDLFTLYSVARLLGDPRLGVRTLVQLDSEGGSVTAAMAIGHLIRDRGFSTGVDRAAKCFSACVLILAAGVERSIASPRIGVHRPRADVALSATETESQAKTHWDEIAVSMRAYLAAMGISDALLRAMMDVPPNRLRLLSRAETVAFGLAASGARDSGYDRLASAQRAKRLSGSAHQGRFVAMRTAALARARRAKHPQRFAGQRVRPHLVHRDGASMGTRRPRADPQGLTLMSP